MYKGLPLPPIYSEKKQNKEISDLPNLGLVLVTGRLIYKTKEPNSSISTLNNSTSYLSSPGDFKIIIMEHLKSLNLWLGISVPISPSLSTEDIHIYIHT